MQKGCGAHEMNKPEKGVILSHVTQCPICEKKTLQYISLRSKIAFVKLTCFWPFLWG
jgi:hypothetical protein